MASKTLIELIFFVFLFDTLRHSICQACKNESSKYFFKEKDSANKTWIFIKYFKTFNDLILDCNKTNNIEQYVKNFLLKIQCSGLILI